MRGVGCTRAEAVGAHPRRFAVRPGRPEWLDWLATWFRDNGYSLKKLHRLIVTSSAYRQSSRGAGNPTYVKARAIDQGNRLLWRQNPKRAEAEVFREHLFFRSLARIQPRLHGFDNLDHLIGAKTHMLGACGELL